MKIHFIAIGGSVMHALAISLQQQGNEVSGSDDMIYEPAYSNLKSAGILPNSFGWNSDLIHSDIDVVVLGMHAKADNPELVKAQQLQLSIQSFPELLFEFSKNMERIAVCGSHGKTTTSAMLAHLLIYNEKRCNFVTGGVIKSLGESIQLKPEANSIVIEGDEYLSSPLDRSSKFLHYKASITILTGIAWDHINVFPTYKEYLDTFSALLYSIPSNGTLIFNADDLEVLALVNKHKNLSIQLVPVSLSNVVYHSDNTHTIVEYQSNTYRLPFFGSYNISNALYAVNAAKELGVSIDNGFKALEQFQGVGKRMELIQHKGKAIAYRDFAHSPSKVKACISGIVQQFEQYDISCFVEFHTFSSIDESFWPEYQGIFSQVQHGYFFVDREAFSRKGKKINYDKLISILGIHEKQLISDSESLKNLWNTKKNDPNSVIVFMSSGNFANTSFS